MITLRIKSEKGTLKCEFTEEPKPAFYNSNGEFPNRDLMNNQMFDEWNNSFTEITLSVEAREYLMKYLRTNFSTYQLFELSGKETECFEATRVVRIKPLGEEFICYKLNLKSVPVAENVEQSIAPESEYRKRIMKLADDVIRETQPTEMKTAEQIFHNKLVHYNPEKFPHGMKKAFYRAMETYASQFKPQPTDDVDWDEVFDLYVKESEQVAGISLAVNLFHFLKSKFKITRR